MIRLLVLYSALIGKSMGLSLITLGFHLTQDPFAFFDLVKHIPVDPAEAAKFIRDTHLIPGILPQIQPEPQSSELRLLEVTGQQVAGRMDMQCTRDPILELPAIEGLADFIRVSAKLQLPCQAFCA